MDISDEDIKKAASILSTRLSHSQLDESLHRFLPPQLLKSGPDGIEGTKLGKAQLLVEARGSELLADAGLRKNLVKGDPGIATILAGPSDSDDINLEEVAIRAWHPGKETAKKFVRILGFPAIFSGFPGHSRPETLVEIPSQHEVPPLMDFQEDVIEQLLEIMERKNGHEAMISLPTGAGKTRVAMEAIIQYQNKHPEGIIIWLATTGEICEQACQTYLELRRAYPPSVDWQLHRYWGGHNLNYKFERGLMVASVQKLRSQIEFELIPYNLLNRIKIIFFDEGHHAIAPTYLTTIKYLEQGGDVKPIPVIGLTATPGRGSDPTSKESRRLAKRFGKRLVIPRGEGWDDPVRRLQNEKILSQVKSITIRTKLKYSLSGRMARHWEEFKDFSPEFLQNVSRDVTRNAIIIDQINKRTSDRRGVIYACSVEHAEHLAFLLRRAGFNAATITADTRSVIRDRNFKQFKSGKIQLITNFGILTTGVDIPSMDLIVLARPVVSQVLYEQMIGRGLRGPKFGGTDECVIMDFEDNINYHGRPLAYSRFRWLWDYEAVKRPRVESVQKEKPDMAEKWKNIISQGESDQLEFKSSLRWDYKTKQPNKILENMTAKTLSAFMNTEGGTLFIGVDDDGVILGIQKDLKTLGRKQSKDGFKLHLTNIINNCLGKEFHQLTSFLIEHIDGKDVCIIEVLPSPRPVFLNLGKDKEFYIRTNASSQSMNIEEAIEYINIHWEER